MGCDEPGSEAGNGQMGRQRCGLVVGLQVFVRSFHEKTSCFRALTTGIGDATFYTVTRDRLFKTLLRANSGKPEGAELRGYLRQNVCIA